MLKNRALRTALLAVSLVLAPAALAETPQRGLPYIFETVDGIKVVDTIRIEVTGILQGEGTPRTFTFIQNVSSPENSLYFARCERFALLTMNKPGAYLFEMVQLTNGSSSTCRLTRR
ncbi:hypothetical protein [Pyxidicoccus xibeiensis]|uniref:hypothetical protein n=1 Tax=Pyxidicoccus xibeiensis TaxID=2906759 RepID=UPI0020A70E16|nr:hypothetical protein [Pyxidicoccus xibeiensis]MCP3141694.1 hypothetical protein [Pyxidicoccus xibeiensis]